MNMFPDNPAKYLSEILKQADQFFYEISNSLGFEFSDVNLYMEENDGEYIITCELPEKIDKDQIKVYEERHTLFITGHINQSSELKTTKIYKKQDYMGQFRRMVTLPPDAAPEGIKASCKNNLLIIRVPKAHDLRSNIIDIEIE
ncbi:MAG: Hsp20/alpha crystallin family protein [Bacillaceae bacterium]|nr:Hsp20/alpha crystallin family protein [Bacillaceae bacterium]